MKQTIEKKVLSIGLIAIGITAIVFAIICFNERPWYIGYCDYVYKEVYGGDAYTGIQNAAAQTASNIYYLDRNFTHAVSLFTDCMGYLFLIVGLLLLLMGMVKTINVFKKKPIILNEAQPIVKDE